MEQKQTAVEWLEEQLISSLGIELTKHQKKLFNDVFIKQAKEMEKQQRKIEFPSDKEIKEYIDSRPYYGHCTSEYCEGIEDGIKWVMNKIQGGNNEQ